MRTPLHAMGFRRLALACALSLLCAAISAYGQDLNIGFITGRGADAGVEEAAWEAVGIEKTNLGAGDFDPVNLSTYDVIAIGVVAYDQNTDLKDNFEALKDYAEAGGYLLTIDFQQDNSWDKNFLPHSLTLFDDDLDAAAGAEVQDHPIWHTPNTITDDHFGAEAWAAGDFMADGPQEAPGAWEPLLLAGGSSWPVIVGAEAGSGFVVFNSIQVLQQVGRAPNDLALEVMENLLLWRGVRAVEAAGKLATAWGTMKGARR
ncbi:MAG: hypothetical protein ABGY41_02610 [Candidatus Poribacteria bacterium]